MSVSSGILLALCLLLSSAQSEQLTWRALVSERTFTQGLSFDVYFHGNGTDVNVQWQPSSANFTGKALVLSVRQLDANGQPCLNRRYMRPPASSHQLLPLFVPAGHKSLNMTATLVDATNNYTLPNASQWHYVNPELGRNRLTAQVVATPQGGFNFSLDAVVVNYTCQWTAEVQEAGANTTRTVTVVSPLTLKNTQYGTWRCTVPNDFDDRLPAGTNFTMAVLSSDRGPVTPASPVVLATGSLAINMTLPVKSCPNANLTFSGFYFLHHRYFCSFAPEGGQTQGTLLSANALVCPLPLSGSPYDSVMLWESYGGTTALVHTFKKHIEYESSCSHGGGGHDDDNGDDLGIPIWGWVLIGAASAFALALVLGPGIWCFRRLRRDPYAEYVHLQQDA